LVHAGQAPPAAVKEIKLGTAHPGTIYAVTVAVKTNGGDRTAVTERR
jgi:hypothetical protein